MDKTRGYLLGIAIGLPAMNVVRVMNAFVTIDNGGNLSVISSVTLTVVDIVLDIVVAFVIHGDTFEMGLATSISYYAALLVLLTHFRRRERLMRFSLKNVRREEIIPILTKGLPVYFWIPCMLIAVGFMYIYLYFTCFLRTFFPNIRLS